MADNDDYETIEPHEIASGDYIETDDEPGTIWVVERQSSFLDTPKRTRYTFDVRERGTATEAELTIDAGRTVRRYAKPPR